MEEDGLIRVLIVAPYASVRAGLHAFLADADDCQVIGDVSGSAELERVLPELRPDVVVFDANEGEGMRLLEVLANAAIGLVMLGDSGTGYRMLAERPLPGWAYLLKEAEGPEIIGAVRAVAAGLVVLDRNLAPLLNRAAPTFTLNRSSTCSPTCRRLPPLPCPPSSASARQRGGNSLSRSL